MYRQGDVLLVPTNGALPSNPKEVPIDPCGRVVLAHGEATGHHHSFAPSPNLALLEGADEHDRWLNVKEESQLTHQEHDTINVPPGTYRVVRQRQYTPEKIEYVAD